MLSARIRRNTTTVAAAVLLVIAVSCSGPDESRATPGPATSGFVLTPLSDDDSEVMPYAIFPDSTGSTPATAPPFGGTPDIDLGVYDRLPDGPLPEGFYLPGAGAGNFDQYTRVLAESGDWLLATHATSAYPVPGSWTTLTSLVEENFIAFDRDGVEIDGFEVERAEAAVRISPLFQTHTTDINEALDGHESQALAQPGVVVVDRAAFGADRGYLLLSGADDSTYYALIYLTLRTHQVGDGFDSLMAFWSEDGAEEYYSIVRTIVGGWVDLDNRMLGAELPEELPTS